MFLKSAIVSGLVGLALCNPAQEYAVHERRDAAPAGWARVEKLDRRAILPMRIGLTQSNLEKGHDWLMDVSHPESDSYGKHWTVDQIAEAFAPRYVPGLC